MSDPDDIPINHPLRPAVVVRPIRYHVHPLYGRPHELDGAPCWCAPTVTADGICIHRDPN